MAKMTWKEFKDAIDKELKEKGIDESTEIWYIDISFPNKDDFEKGRLEFGLNDLCGITIGET